MSTIINSNQIRQSGDTSHQTLINESQIRASGDTSTGTLINANQVEASSPYQSVDWIRSAGIQLDTGLKPDDTIKIQVKFILQVFDASGTFIGYTSYSESNAFRFFRADSTTYLDYGSGDGKNRISGSLITSKTKIYEVEFGNRYVKDLSTGTTKFSGTAVSFSQKTYTIGIFDAVNQGKIYYLKIWKGGELVRDYLPKYKTTTQTYGLYDSVNQSFLSEEGLTGGNDE